MSTNKKLNHLVVVCKTCARICLVVLQKLVQRRKCLRIKKHSRTFCGIVLVKLFGQRLRKRGNWFRNGSVQRHYMPKRPQRKVCLMVNIHAVNMDAARLLKTKVVLTQPMPKVNFLPATCYRSLRLLHKDIEHVLVTRLKVPIKEHARPHTALQKNVAHAHLLMQ